MELLEAEAEAASTGKAARRYKDFRYAALDSWSRIRSRNAPLVPAWPRSARASRR